MILLNFNLSISEGVLGILNNETKEEIE